MPSLLDLLKSKIPKDLLPLVRRSFDIIGDIAVIDIPEELEGYEEEIAEALMKIHKNVKVVAKISSKTEGLYRIRRVKVVKGENRTHTIHKENGLKFYLDINKVFYTPRLANERKRISKLVNEGETVGDLFAGVGPYSILIAKENPKTKVYSVDINEYAFGYLVKNIIVNKVENINAYKADSKRISKVLFQEFFDRIIMNIPKFAEDFLDIPFISLKRGGMCHYYDFARKEEINLVLEKIREKARKYDKNVEIIKYRFLNEIGPRIYRVVVDFKVYW